MKFLRIFEEFDYSSQPEVKPETDTQVIPKRRTKRPSPLRKDKPSVTPKPKMGMSDEFEVAQKFIDLVDTEELKNYLEK